MKISKRQTTAICIVLVLAIVYLPLLAMRCWHFAHSTTRLVGRYQISIPASFVAVDATDGLKILRLKVKWRPKLYAMDQVVFRSGVGNVDLPRWADRGLKAAKDSGYADAKEYTLPFGETTVACIQRNQKEEYVPVAVFCRTSDGMTVEYSGDTSGAAELSGLFGRVRESQ